MPERSLHDELRLPPQELRWRCDPADFGFETTAEVEPIAGVIGQDAAVDSLRFGLECSAHGQNIFVKGLTGTGRMTLIERLLKEIQPGCPPGADRCYVRNFKDPMRPALITLPRGSARKFERMVDELADFIRDELGDALNAESIAERRAALKATAEARMKELAQPLENEAADKGMALVTVVSGNIARPALFPRHEGKPVAQEQYALLHEQGKVSDEEHENYQKSAAELEEKLNDLHGRVHDLVREHLKAVAEMMKQETRALLQQFTKRIARTYPGERVTRFLDGIVNDVVEHRLEAVSEDGDFTRLYRVNVILSHENGEACPTIIENSPRHIDLIGAIDRVVIDNEIRPADHMSIRAGSLLAADGGFLVLDAREVLSEPGAWRSLVRTLRTRQLEITSLEELFLGRVNLLKPEPIDIEVKVILVGDSYLYYLLDSLDPDFPQLFKVLAEFDTVIDNSPESRGQYASVVARIADEDDLLPFTADAVAALAEHGARIASNRAKLSTRFSRLADIAREASFIARKEGEHRVSGDHIRETVRRTKRRANLPSRKFREMVERGVIEVETSGTEIGQINGLAVSYAGPLTYGFPARITASIGPGSGGVINVDRESALSGAIHTKGFYILEGLLRHLLRTEHPLTFNASVAFEQSYGGIDGDSASGAEVCCLMSALTGVALRQDLAMTGAIDQRGSVMAIGGVNEKIEGFFDICHDSRGGLTGTQGVIIPRSNVDDLMLRHDVVEAAAAGRFHVYPVSDICQALELLTGMSAGEHQPDGSYRKGTLLHIAMQRAREYWEKVSQAKGMLDEKRKEPDTAEDAPEDPLRDLPGEKGPLGD